MKKILVIDESPLIRDFLNAKLNEYGFDVVVALNALDGVAKARQELPDLIISDYYVSKKSPVDFLERLHLDINTKHIPLMLAAGNLERKQLIQLAKYNVKQVFTKPIKIDLLLKKIAAVLKIHIEFDNTPCIIEAHMNENVLFIEVAQGLNKEKIELLKYKITELLNLYQVNVPRVLIMMTSVNLTSADSIKLATFMQTIIDYSQAKMKNIKILTADDYVKKYLVGRSDLEEIEVVSNLEAAMDGLLGRRAGGMIDGETNTVHSEFLTARHSKEERIQMRFQEDMQDLKPFDLQDAAGGIISIVDDDIIIQELVKTVFAGTKFTVKTYDNGRLFVDDPDFHDTNLVFLDLMMPEMDGFTTLQHLRNNNVNIPVIVLSALSKRETVVKALSFKVKSYMIKPLQPDEIMKKATEILKSDF